MKQQKEMATGQSGQLKWAENPSVHGLVWEYLDLGLCRERKAKKITGWWD